MWGVIAWQHSIIMGTKTEMKIHCSENGNMNIKSGSKRNIFFYCIAGLDRWTSTWKKVTSENTDKKLLD